MRLGREQTMGEIEEPTGAAPEFDDEMTYVEPAPVVEPGRSPDDPDDRMPAGLV